MDTLESIKINENLKNLFKDVETPFVNELKTIYGNKFTIEEDRANFDYIYESSKLISLSGKKLHGKKNHYNNFIKNNNFYVEEINESNIEDCIKAACE